jgi:hypothetical protein
MIAKTYYDFQAANYGWNYHETGLRFGFTDSKHRKIRKRSAIERKSWGMGYGFLKKPAQFDTIGFLAGSNCGRSRGKATENYVQAC